jgi:hypothetical protein
MPARSFSVVVVLVPVALGVPAVLVFVPPLVTFPPAPLPRLAQFSTLMLGLLAITSMPLDGLVELMIRVGNPALTPVLVFCMKSGPCSEKQSHGQDGS